jgi:hypothetical protein
VSTVLAWRFGEGEALQLHATETLMILSAAIVVIVESSDEDPIDAERLDALVSQLKPAHVLHRIQINEG